MTFITNPINSITSTGNTTTSNVGGQTTLNENLSNSDTTAITLTDATEFPTSGTIKIESEYITYTGKTGNDLDGTIVRGAFNTTAAAHSTSTQVVGVYIGTSDLNAQPDVMVSLKSDTAGMEYFDFSTNNTDWDTFPVTGFNVSANIHEYHTAVKGSRYFRIRFENSSTSATTSFRINSYFGVFQPGNLPLNQSISSDSDSRIVRSVGVGSNPLGVYSNIRTDGESFVSTTNLGGTTIDSSGGITSGATTINVVGTSSFPSTGAINIDIEEISYSGKTATSFTGCTRGINGTTAASHIDTSIVGGMYCGDIISTDGFSQVQTHILSSTDGILQIDWFSDSGATDLIRNLDITYDSSSNFQLYAAPVFSPYIRYCFKNSTSTPQTDFFFQTLLRTKAISGQILSLDAFISNNMVANLGRNVLVGTTDGGKFVNVPVTPEGHLEVGIHGPILPFSSVHSEKMTPVFQSDSVYGVNPSETMSIIGHSTGGISSATITGTNNLFKCSTGTTSLSFSTLQSVQRLRYRPGQGVIIRFTALFSTPAASSKLIAGIGTAEAGLFFGYNGTSFGILYSTNGLVEMILLTVTTASTNTNDYKIELNGIIFTTTATNNASTLITAREIAKGTYTGWCSEQRGSTICFIASTVGARSGTYTLNNTGTNNAVGTFGTPLQTGSATTDTWIPQTSWNGDKFDGTGKTGIILDTSKGNLYQINVQAGFGSIAFLIETSPPGNNSTLTTCHVIKYPNTNTGVSISQPSFPFVMSAQSLGSTTNVSVSSESFAGFIEGKKVLSGPRFTYNRTTNGFIAAAAYYPFFTVTNSFGFGHTGITERPNQSVINIVSMSCSHDDATPITFFLLKHTELAGPTDYQKFSASSVSYWDIASTTATVADNDHIVFSLQTGQSTGETIIFDPPILLQPGETITLAGTTVTGTATYVNASLNTREDQ